MKMNLNQIVQQFESAVAGTKAKSSATGKVASKETLWKSFLEQFPGLGTAVLENGKAGLQVPKIKLQKQNAGKTQSWSIPINDVAPAEVSVASAKNDLVETPKTVKKDSETDSRVVDTSKGQNAVLAMLADKKANLKADKKKTTDKESKINPVSPKDVPATPKIAVQNEPSVPVVKASPAAPGKEIKQEIKVNGLKSEPISKQQNEKTAVAENDKKVIKEGFKELKTQIADKKQGPEPLKAPVHTKEEPASKSLIGTGVSKQVTSNEREPKPVAPKDITELKTDVYKPHNQARKPVEEPNKNDKKVENKPSQTVQKDISPDTKTNLKKLSDLPGVQHHIVEQKTDAQKPPQPVNHQNKMYDKAEFTKQVSEIAVKPENAAEKPATKNSSPVNVENKVQNQVHEAVEAIETGQIKSGKKEDRSGRNQSDINFAKTDNLINAEGFKQNVSSKIVQVVQKQISSGKPGQWTQWQQHKFIMDDGKSINLAMKQTDGVIHLQLGSNNSEMNQMLQHHIQDIKVHLQEHFKLEIDLQFQNTGYQGQGNNGNTNHQQTAAPVYKSSGPSAGSSVRTAVVSESPASVRHLGFNRNEWTG